MKRALLLATSLLAISTTASAGGYLGLGLGTQPGINDEMEAYAVPLGRSLRGLAGVRFGRLSIEGALNDFGVVANVANATHRNVYQLSGALKLNLPLGNNFEGFGRAGVERTWLDLNDQRYNLTGDGFLVGGGFEFRLDAILTNASLFVDYTIHHATLGDASNNQVDETARIWGLGFTIGI